jgi:uncharacterized protein YjiS (DUF1127 family)
MKAMTQTVPALLREPARARFRFSPRVPLRMVTLWLAVWHERQALRRLDPHLLKDLGIAQEDAEREALRRPWDIPATRRARALEPASGMR